MANGRQFSIPHPAPFKWNRTVPVTLKRDDLSAEAMAKVEARAPMDCRCNPETVNNLVNNSRWKNDLNG
jgi:hypothetical protein